MPGLQKVNWVSTQDATEAFGGEAGWVSDEDDDDDEVLAVSGQHELSAAAQALALAARGYSSGGFQQQQAFGDDDVPVAPVAYDPADVPDCYPVGVGRGGAVGVAVDVAAQFSLPTPVAQHPGIPASPAFRMEQPNATMQQGMQQGMPQGMQGVQQQLPLPGPPPGPPPGHSPGPVVQLGAQSWAQPRQVVASVTAAAQLGSPVFSENIAGVGRLAGGRGGHVPDRPRAVEAGAAGSLATTTPAPVPVEAQMPAPVPETGGFTTVLPAAAGNAPGAQQNPPSHLLSVLTMMRDWEPDLKLSEAGRGSKVVFTCIITCGGITVEGQSSPDKKKAREKATIIWLLTALDCFDISEVPAKILEEQIAMRRATGPKGVMGANGVPLAGRGGRGTLAPGLAGPIPPPPDIPPPPPIGPGHDQSGSGWMEESAEPWMKRRREEEPWDREWEPRRKAPGVPLCLVWEERRMDSGRPYPQKDFATEYGDAATYEWHSADVALQLRMKKDDEGKAGIQYTGQLVDGTTPDGPAERAGILAGMRLLYVAGKPVGSTESVTEAFASAQGVFTVACVSPEAIAMVAAALTGTEYSEFASVTHMWPEQCNFKKPLPAELQDPPTLRIGQAPIPHPDPPFVEGVPVEEWERGGGGAFPPPVQLGANVWAQPGQEKQPGAEKQPAAEQSGAVRQLGAETWAQQPHSPSVPPSQLAPSPAAGGGRGGGVGAPPKAQELQPQMQQPPQQPPQQQVPAGQSMVPTAVAVGGIGVTTLINTQPAGAAGAGFGGFGGFPAPAVGAGRGGAGIAMTPQLNPGLPTIPGAAAMTPQLNPGLPLIAGLGLPGSPPLNLAELGGPPPSTPPPGMTPIQMGQIPELGGPPPSTPPPGMAPIQMGQIPMPGPPREDPPSAANAAAGGASAWRPQPGMPAEALWDQDWLPVTIAEGAPAGMVAISWEDGSYSQVMPDKVRQRFAGVDIPRVD